jgi:hypothetical protein
MVEWIARFMENRAVSVLARSRGRHLNALPDAARGGRGFRGHHGDFDRILMPGRRTGTIPGFMAYFAITASALSLADFTPPR